MIAPLRIKDLGNADAKDFLQGYGADYLRLWVRTKAWELFLADHAQEWESYRDSIANADPNKEMN